MAKNWEKFTDDKKISALKENNQQFKTLNLWTFFLFSWVWIWIPNLETDPLTSLNPIQSESWAETLIGSRVPLARFYIYAWCLLNGYGTVDKESTYGTEIHLTGAYNLTRLFSALHWSSWSNVSSFDSRKRYLPSKRVISSPFSHKSIFFSKML